MSKYTIELRFLRDYMFKFDYDYYMKGLVPDEVYEKSKKEFEDKFINHYMFDEICVDTPDRFFYMLKDYLDNAFKTYNELYKTELEVERQHINFLLNKDLVETNKTTVEITTAHIALYNFFLSLLGNGSVVVVVWLVSMNVIGFSF